MAAEGRAAQLAPGLLVLVRHLGEVGHRRADTSVVLRRHAAVGGRGGARGGRVSVREPRGVGARRAPDPAAESAAREGGGHARRLVSAQDTIRLADYREYT